jgi:hypothetical protein
MYCPDPRIVRAMLGLRQQETQSESEFRRRLHLVRPKRQKGPLRWLRHVLCHVGQRLVVVGQRLEEYGLPQPSM